MTIALKKKKGESGNTQECTILDAWLEKILLRHLSKKLHKLGEWSYVTNQGKSVSGSAKTLRLMCLRNSKETLLLE